MAKKRNPPGELRIRLGTKDGTVTVDQLIAALENALDMLRNIERHFPHTGDPIAWRITRASMRSPLTMTLTPVAPQKKVRKLGLKIAAAWVMGLKLLEATPALPPHFDDYTLESAKKFVSVSKGDGPALKVFGHKESVTPTTRTIEHAEELEARARVYIDYATIEGRLEVISTHKVDSFFIWEVLTNHRIECFSTPELFDQAKNLLRKRVAISGRAKYRNNRPVSINVEEIRVLREQGELPQRSDIGPFDITGGTSSEEHVRRFRDAK